MPVVSYCHCPAEILAGRYLCKIDFFFDSARKYVMIWWHKVLEIRYTMADLTPTSSTPKDIKQRYRILKRIDPDDPNDRPFKLVTMFVFLMCSHNSPFFSFQEQHPPPPPTSFIN